MTRETENFQVSMIQLNVNAEGSMKRDEKQDPWGLGLSFLLVVVSFVVHVTQAPTLYRVTQSGVLQACIFTQSRLMLHTYVNYGFC